MRCYLVSSLLVPVNFSLPRFQPTLNKPRFQTALINTSDEVEPTPSASVGIFLSHGSYVPVKFQFFYQVPVPVNQLLVAHPSEWVSWSSFQVPVKFQSLLPNSSWLTRVSELIFFSSSSPCYPTPRGSPEWVSEVLIQVPAPSSCPHP